MKKILSLILSIAFLIPLIPIHAAGNGYSFSRTVTIDHTKIGSVDITNEPVFINGTLSYLATVANGGKVQNSSGFDVIFTSDSGCTTKLNWETRTYTAASGAVAYWVQVPTVSHTTDTVFYVCYGNSSISTDQSNMTGTWRSDFKRVFHVDNGTTLDGTDSTGNANLTNSGSSASTVKVNGGVSFGGSGSMSGSNTGLPSPTSAWTYAFWWNADAQGPTVGRLLSFYNGTQSIQIGRVNSGVYVATGNGSSDVGAKQSLTTSDPAGLEFIVLTFDGVSTYKTYVNGSDASQNNYPNSDLTLFTGNSTTLYFGQRGNGSNINALADEMFILNTVPSTSEITGWYNNTNSPSTFTTIGAEQGLASSHVSYMFGFVSFNFGSVNFTFQ